MSLETTKTGEELSHELRFKFIVYALIPLALAFAISGWMAFRGLTDNSEHLNTALQVRTDAYRAHARLMKQDEITKILISNPELFESLSEEKISSYDEHIRILSNLARDEQYRTIATMAKWLIQFEENFLRKADTKILESVLSGNVPEEVNLYYLKLREEYDSKMGDIISEADSNVMLAKTALKAENRSTTVNLGMMMGLAFLILIVVYAIMEKQIKGSQDRLYEELVNAEKATENKAAFLANMSHEIRTPLNGVIGLADLLAQTELDDKQTELLSTIQRSGMNLKGIVDDILDLSKLNSGNFDAEQTVFNLHESVNDAAKLFRGLAYKKQLHLRVTIKTNTPEWVRGPQLALHQVINNLVGNAIKFCDEGAVNITASINPDSSHIVIAIADTGIGIPADKLKDIFSEYKQAESSTTRLYGGTGLGLSICHRLSEAIGGDLSVESQEGVGSTFTFRFPITIAEKPEDHVDDDQADLGALRVLAADDDSINRMVLKGKLTGFGVSFKIVNDGNEVLEELEQNQYDLIFMDCYMPTMDGFEATKSIRETNKDLPIYALSASTSPKEKDMASKAGMNGFLTKPIDSEELEKVMTRIAAKCAKAKAA